VLGEVAEEDLRKEDSILWELKSGSYAALQGHPPTPYLLETLAEAEFDEHMAEHETLLARFDEVRALPLDTVCEALKSWFLDHATNHIVRLTPLFAAM
jgi:hypothetical protein